MKQLRTNVLAAAGLALIAGVLSVLLSRPSRAQQAGGLPALERRVTAVETAVSTLQSSSSSQASQIAALQTALTNETNRAEAAESALQTALDTEAGARQAADQALSDRDLALENKTQFMAADPYAMSTTFSRCNVFINDGGGSTDTLVANSSGDGIGNLIVGYNASRSSLRLLDVRTGSHNIIAGDYNSYSSYGGLVAGRINEISGPWAAVSGGAGNTASGNSAAVSGGVFNTASGYESSVSGGEANVASTYEATVSGGYGNTASGELSSVSGGQQNVASGNTSSVSGGLGNVAGGHADAVSGGAWITIFSSQSDGPIYGYWAGGGYHTP